jgi:hypothetical protein
VPGVDVELHPAGIRDGLTASNSTRNLYDIESASAARWLCHRRSWISLSARGVRI